MAEAPSSYYKSSLIGYGVQITPATFAEVLANTGVTGDPSFPDVVIACYPTPHMSRGYYTCELFHGETRFLELKSNPDVEFWRVPKYLLRSYAA